MSVTAGPTKKHPSMFEQDTFPIVHQFSGTVWACAALFQVVSDFFKVVLHTIKQIRNAS